MLATIYCSLHIILLSSYIVVPIKDLVSILFLISTTVCQQSHIVILPSSMNMNVNYNTIRERPKFSSNNSSRESSILSNTSSMAYYECMEALNNILPDEVQDPSNSPQLSYTSNNLERGKGKQVSMAADNSL